MLRQPRSFGLVLVTSLLICQSLVSWAQTIGPAPSATPVGASSAFEGTAFIHLSANQTVQATTNKGISDYVGLQPGQVVDITVQFTPARAGHIIAVEPLDGGRLLGTTNRLAVSGEGTISFRFRAGSSVGLSQVSLRDGAAEIGLQFWVIDQQNPGNNPPVINAGN